MEALLVVDIQPETFEGRRVGDLVGKVNALVGSYPAERVVYIANIAPFAKVPSGNPFAEGLRIVSANVLFKRLPNAFSNPALKRLLDALDIDDVAVVGIDGNWCVKATALGARRLGLAATVIAAAVVSKDERAFRNKTIPKLQAAGIAVA